MNTDIIPVIAPIGVGDDGQTYNINADTAAGAIGGALRARKLLMLTDVRGVLDADKRFLAEPDRRRGPPPDRDRHGLRRHDPQARDLPRGGRRAACEAAVILDGRVPHAILLELFTEHGFGTQVLAAAR